jgi:8-oxo-dGTP pyrophosphatase MutT (NUDIX family)
MASKQQFAALPFRVEDDDISVLLITTRRKRRWSVPKGDPMLEKTPHATAATEAYEEAGLLGAINARPVGRFKHRKQKGKRKIACNVQLFPLKVKRQMKRFPERGQRDAIWLSAREAAKLVHKPQLSRLIEQFARQKKPKKLR